METSPDKVGEVLSEVAQATVDVALSEDGQPQAAAQKPFKTTGQKIHKWGTYLGMDWILNTAAGVGFAYWGKVTPTGKKWWSSHWEKFFDKALGFIKDNDSRKYGVEKGNMFVSIIAGGMFIIPPLMVLENNKVKKSIAQFFDRRIYGKDKVENDPQFQAAYAAIDNEPKKDFWTGMKARFAALAPLLAFSVFIPFTRDGLQTYGFGPISNASEAVATKLGFKGEKLKQIVAMHDKKKNPVSAWKFIHDNVAFDAAQALPYAGMHAFFYDLFAKKKQDKAKPEQPLDKIIADTKTEEAPIAAFAEKQDAPASHLAREANRRVEAETATPTLSA